MFARSKTKFFLLTLIMGLFFISSQALASKPIAKVADFKGEVLIQSDSKILEVTQVGQILNEGDRVQTKQGLVQITFNDGAIMKVRPFTSVMVQEREEKGGWLLFKTRQTVRRITCFVGKLWFKSGASKRKNYLQSPTAVCGIRGSEADIGFEPAMLETYLKIYDGEAKIV